MNKRKQIPAILLSAGLILASCPAFLNAYPVYAAADEQVLSGEIGDLEIEEGVKTIILNGVTQSGEEDELTINGDAVIEIADGTENQLNCITSLGNVEFTGGGNLDLGTFFTAGDIAMFDHTGSIQVSDSGICSMTGDLYFNSGSVDVRVTDELIIPVITYSGNLYMNGGSLSADGQVMAVYAGATMDLEGGALTATSTTGAAFTVGKGETGCITVSDSFAFENGLMAGEGISTEEDVTVSTIVNTDGDSVQDVSGSGPDAEDKIQEAHERLAEVMYVQADASQAEETADEESGSEAAAEDADDRTGGADVSEAELSDSQDAETEAVAESEDTGSEVTEAAAAETAADTDAAATTSKRHNSTQMIILILVACVAAAVIAAGITAASAKKKGQGTTGKRKKK